MGRGNSLTYHEKGMIDAFENDGHSQREIAKKNQQIKVFFIIKGFQTIVFIFIVISTMFRPIRPPAFFRCLSNSGTFMELWTTSFIESSGVACSDSVSHNQVQALSIPVLLLACSQDWTWSLLMIVSLEAKGTNAYNRYAICPSELIFGIYKLDVLTWLELLLLCMIFTRAYIQIFFFSSSLLNYRFPYCIQLYTWSY